MEFSLKQLSWIVIGALGIGGTCYMNMNNKIDDLDKKVAVMSNQMDIFQKQLDRIETKISK